MKDYDQPTVLVSGVLMHAGDRVWTTVYRNLSVKDPQAIYAERICGVIRDDLQTALFGNLLVPLSRCSFCENVIQLDNPAFPVVPGPRSALAAFPAG